MHFDSCKTRKCDSCKISIIINYSVLSGSSSASTTTCTVCQAGTYSPKAASPLCTNCDPGSSSKDNSTICTFCVPGSYAQAAGSASCSLCDPGE